MAQSDAHEKPSDALRVIYKRLQKGAQAEPQTHVHGDVKEAFDPGEEWLPTEYHDPVVLDKFFDQFVGEYGASETYGLHAQSSDSRPSQAYTHKRLSTLKLFPALLPSAVQVRMLDCLLHRDLVNPKHKTNVDLHYDMLRPEHSFFDLDRRRVDVAVPKDPALHKPMTVEQLLNKKLRWMTLGCQYDWTNKVYPDDLPPPFPHDLERLLSSLFPSTKPEAAILNVYSPGDTLSVHRDVSEECENGLISVSIGCDAIFMVGLEEGDNSLTLATIRLRSGDVLYMEDEARHAWHGVPKILANTCPDFLEKWPASSATTKEAIDRRQQWQGWLKSKRVNFNVRQMRPS